MRATPPNGEAFARGVQLCLARERNWTLWKEGKCRPFERYADADDDVADELDSASLPRVDIRNIRKTIRSNTQLWSGQGGRWKEDLGGEATSYTPDLDAFLQPMLDAMDPENCVEDEYHPKHDKLYNWRGLRLVYASDLQCLDPCKTKVVLLFDLKMERF